MNNCFLISAYLASLKAKVNSLREVQSTGGEEMAFYDVVASNYLTIYDQALLRELIHDVVITLKKNLKVD